jgi:hypothetical protein
MYFHNVWLLPFHTNISSGMVERGFRWRMALRLSAIQVLGSAPPFRKFVGSVLDCFACASRARNDGVAWFGGWVMEAALRQIYKVFLLLFVHKK